MNKEQFIAEVGKPMYDGLIKLRNIFKKFGWSEIKICRERSNKEIIVVEAKKLGHLHWFQVTKDGDVTPCITFMGCK